MSATVADTAQRPLPLTPPNQLDGIDLSLPSKMSFQLPQTPQSPSQPGKASPAESTYTSVGPMALPTPAHSVSGASTSQLSNMPSPDSSKRKREPEDAGNREQRKKIRAEDRELSIQDLHLDVGKKYLLCRTPVGRSLLDPSQDWFDMYKVSEVAATVARTLPNGAKNSLRKTYKGKIKDLNVSGRFDAVDRKEQDNGLYAMMLVPEDEWNMQHVAGHSIQDGIQPDITALLQKAMTMAKGPIPESEWKATVLGDLDAKLEKKPGSKSATSTPKSSSNLAVHKGLSGVAGPQRSVSTSDIPRPKRKIKRTSYADASFEGYGEGYVDDEIVDGGYSTGEGEGTNRRKKVKTNPTSDASPRNAYGPGMVGA